MPPVKPILIATCGNLAAGGDAFGPLVGAVLKRRCPTNVEVVDLDLRPAALMDSLPGRETLVIVDAACSEGEPTGRLIDIDWFSPKRPQLMDDDVLSSHGLSIADQLLLAEQLDMLPDEVRLVAAIVASATVGDTAPVHLPQLVEAAVERIVAFAGGRSEVAGDACHA